MTLFFFHLAYFQGTVHDDAVFSTELWFERLEGRDPWESEWARRFLSSLGRELDGAIERRLRLDRPPSRLLIDLASNRGHGILRDYALTNLRHRDSLETRLYLDALSTTGDSGSILREASKRLDSPLWSIRHASVNALLETPYSPIWFLGNASRDPDPSVRLTAFENLKRLKGLDPALPLVQAWFRTPSDELLIHLAMRRLGALRGFFERIRNDVKLSNETRDISEAGIWLAFPHDDKKLSEVRSILRLVASFDEDIHRLGANALSTRIASIPDWTRSLVGTGELQIDERFLSLLRQSLGVASVDYLCNIIVSPHSQKSTRDHALYALEDFQGSAICEVLTDLFRMVGKETHISILYRAVSVAKKTERLDHPSWRALLSHGTKTKDSDLRARSFRELCRVDGEGIVHECLRTVRGEEDIQTAAQMVQSLARAFGDVQREEVLAYIFQLWKEFDSTSPVSLASIEAIVHCALGDRSNFVIEELRKLSAQNRGEAVLRRVINVLCQIGGAQVQGTLLKLIDESPIQNRAALLGYVLDRHELLPELFVESLAWQHVDLECDSHSPAWRALGAIQSPMFIERFEQLYGTLEESDQESMLRTMSHFRGDLKADSILIRLLDSEKEEGRLSVALSTASGAATPALAPSILSLAKSSSSPDIRIRALRALASFPEVEEVIEYLRTEADPHASDSRDEAALSWRRTAASALAAARPEEGLPHLLPHLFDDALSHWKQRLDASFDGSQKNAPPFDPGVLSTLLNSGERGAHSLRTYLVSLQDSGEFWKLAENSTRSLGDALAPHTFFESIAEMLYESTASMRPKGSSDDFLAHLALGEITRRDGKFSQAAHHYDRAADLASQEVPTQRLLFETLGSNNSFLGEGYEGRLRTRSLQCQLAGLSKEALSPWVQKYSRSLEDSPLQLSEFTMVAFDVGLSVKEARALAARALLKAPHHVELLDTCAILAEFDGEPEIAQKHRDQLRTLVEFGIMPDRGLFWLHEGVAAMISGDLGEARKCVLKAFRTDPSLKHSIPTRRTLAPLKQHPELLNLFIERP